MQIFVLEALPALPVTVERFHASLEYDKRHWEMSKLKSLFPE